MLAFFSRNIEFDKPQVTIENPIFQSTKYREKELCLDNKVQETFGDVFCPKCRNEKCAFFSTNETTNFYDCNITNVRKQIVRVHKVFWQLLWK